VKPSEKDAGPEWWSRVIDSILPTFGVWFRVQGAGFRVQGVRGLGSSRASSRASSPPATARFEFGVYIYIYIYIYGIWCLVFGVRGSGSRVIESILPPCRARTIDRAQFTNNYIAEM